MLKEFARFRNAQVTPKSGANFRALKNSASPLSGKEYKNLGICAKPSRWRFYRVRAQNSISLRDRTGEKWAN